MKDMKLFLEVVKLSGEGKSPWKIVDELGLDVFDKKITRGIYEIYQRYKPKRIKKEKKNKLVNGWKSL